MFSSPSPASCGLIDQRAFFYDSTKRPPMLCVFIAKRAPSGIRLGAIWRSLLMILLTSAFRCVVCSLITLPSSACACGRNVVWFKAASVGWINVSFSVGQPPPVTCRLTMLTQYCFTVLWCICLATLSIPISGLFLSKLSKSVSRHYNESHMLPPASALYICIHMYIYTYVYIYICIYLYIICNMYGTYIYIYVYTHIYTYMYIYLCIHVYTFTFKYTCIYIHNTMNTYTYMYIQRKLARKNGRNRIFDEVTMHVCAFDFVRRADSVIKHKVSCVCVFGPCFLYALVYFVPGATCWPGQTSKPHLFFATSWVSACTHAHMHARASAETQIVGKRDPSQYQQHPTSTRNKPPPHEV